MTTWSIQEQEGAIKAAIISSGFLTAFTGFNLLAEISTRWLGLPMLSTIMHVGLLVSSIMFIRALWMHPNVASHGLRLREIFGNYTDEYLRSRFQRATTVACQLMIGSGFAIYVLVMFIDKHSNSAWISYELVALLPLFIGNLSLYWTLRNTLDDADESANDGDQ